MIQTKEHEQAVRGVNNFSCTGKNPNLLMQMDELINKACRDCCERRVNGGNPRETLRACKPNQGAADCIQKEAATGALRNTKTRIGLDCMKHQ